MCSTTTKILLPLYVNIIILFAALSVASALETNEDRPSRYSSMSHSTQHRRRRRHRRRNRRDPLDRPNFVLFFVDDLGYGDCGFTGHPTTQTPNIDSLAWNGKVLTTWYSACAVCSCSRASLMTGRQWPRTGVQEVYGPVDVRGLSLHETTIAEWLRQKRNYKTAVVGKWHLGHRQAYLPGNRGFDFYLGIPYAADMGNAIYSTCPSSSVKVTQTPRDHNPTNKKPNERPPVPPAPDNDFAAYNIPLIYQEFNHTTILQQPADFTTLSENFIDFTQTFLSRHYEEPFFLYVPFSHVHKTSGYSATWDERNNCQYADCQHQDKSPRGSFGDALAEVDWMVGQVMNSIRQLALEDNTLILFTSDNGPWIGGGLDGGSAGIFQGRYANYHSTGKGSTWEGGLRAPAFAYWKGQIPPHSRSSETISSMDIFPTFSYFAGIPIDNNTFLMADPWSYAGNNVQDRYQNEIVHEANMPERRFNVKLDGQNMADILLHENGRSQHDFLFFYGFCNGSWPRNKVTAVRHGPYKAHFCTAPGLFVPPNTTVQYNPYPMLFHVDHDPSEAFPISTGEMPSDLVHADAMRRIMKAYAMEVATFEYGPTDPLPPGPGEGPGHYGVCCNRTLDCFCSSSSSTASKGYRTFEERPWRKQQNSASGLFSVGQATHHDRYHEILGETNHKVK